MARAAAVQLLVERHVEQLLAAVGNGGRLRRATRDRRQVDGRRARAAAQCACMYVGFLSHSPTRAQSAHLACSAAAAARNSIAAGVGSEASAATKFLAGTHL